MRTLSSGITTLALTFMWVAAGWLVIDILFADPAILIFEDIAILCAVVAPLLYLIGWGMSRLGRRPAAALGRSG